MTATFDVRFHAPSPNWPANPFKFQGKGQVAFEPDFIVVRGSRTRSFRFPERAEHRIKRVDIVNAHTDGPDVFFHVQGVDGTLVVGFSTPDAETAKRIVALLPERWTEAFATAHADREVFDARIDYWSPSTPVIWLLLALNVGVYLLMALERARLHVPLLTALLSWGPGKTGQLDAFLRMAQLVPWGANAGRLTLHGQPWRLVSSMFVHGFLLHLLFNMFGLWQAGRLVERVFGSARFLALYLSAGLCGSLASVLWNPMAKSVGASGAVLGILGGLLAFMQRENSGIPPTVVKDLRPPLLLVLLFNLGLGVLYPYADNAAHVGGLVGGYLAGFVLARSLHLPGQPSRA